MNRITRMLMMSGLGLATALTIGVGPASAATATGQSTSPSASSASQADRRHDRDDDDDRVMGVFRSYRDCDRVGDRGEDRGRWDDYECERRGWGDHRRFVLTVSWDDDDDDDDHGWDN